MTYNSGYTIPSMSELISLWFNCWILWAIYVPFPTLKFCIDYNLLFVTPDWELISRLWISWNIETNIVMRICPLAISLPYHYSYEWWIHLGFFPTYIGKLALKLSWCICVKSRRWGYLVTWFCYHLTANPGNKTTPPSWPDPYVITYTSKCRILDLIPAMTWNDTCNHRLSQYVSDQLYSTSNSRCNWRPMINLY